MQSTVKKMKGGFVFRLEVPGKEGRRCVLGDVYIPSTCAREANDRAQKLEIEPSRHNFAFAIESGAHNRSSGMVVCCGQDRWGATSVQTLREGRGCWCSPGSGPPISLSSLSIHPSLSQTLNSLPPSHRWAK